MSDVKCKHCGKEIWLTCHEYVENGEDLETAHTCVDSPNLRHEPADPPQTGTAKTAQPNATSEAQVIAQRIADAKREVAGWTEAKKRNAVATLYSGGTAEQPQTDEEWVKERVPNAYSRSAFTGSEMLQIVDPNRQVTIGAGIGNEAWYHARKLLEPLSAPSALPPLEKQSGEHPKRYSIEYRDCLQPSAEGTHQWTREQRNGMKKFALRLLDELDQRERQLLALTAKLADAMAGLEMCQELHGQVESELAAEKEKREAYERTVIDAVFALGIAPKEDKPHDWINVRAERAEAENKVLRRLYENKYPEWANAGGSNQCAHGYAAGIPCRQCDEAAVAACTNKERE